MEKKHEIDAKAIFEEMLKEAKNEVSYHKSNAEMYVDELREAREHFEYLQECYDKSMTAVHEYKERVAALTAVLDNFDEKGNDHEQ